MWRSQKSLFQAMSLDAWLESLITASPATALAIGIGLTVAGSGLMAIGSVVMKIGIHEESKRLRRDISVPLSSQLWWLGVMTYSVGAFLHIIGLAFAPASILAPLNSLGLVANAAAAVMFLHETLSYTEIVCTLGAVVGVSLCAVSSFLPHDESCVVSGVDSWTDPLYLVYISVCGAALLVLLILINNSEARAADAQWEEAFRRHLEAGHIELTELGAVGGVGLGSASYSPYGVRENDTVSKDQQHQGVGNHGLGTKAALQFVDAYPGHIGVFYSIVAGIVGAQCVLQLKECSAFLKLAVDNPNVWWQLQPYLSGIFGIVSIVLQMHFLNMALARGDATLVIPSYYVFWTIFGTLGGFLKFHEIFGFSFLQLSLFFLGFLFTLISVALMASMDIERVQYNVERTATLRSGTYEEQALETPLSLGVPLAVGLGIIPVGKLAGRLRTLSTGPKHLIRRTQSLTEFRFRHPSEGFPQPFQVSGQELTPIRRQWGAGQHLDGTPVPYTWTVTGATGFRGPHLSSPAASTSASAPRRSGDYRLLPAEGESAHAVRPTSPEARRSVPDKQQVGQFRGAQSSHEPLQQRATSSREADVQSQRPSGSPSGSDWQRRRGGKKYKGISEIVFEEDPQHGSCFPFAVVEQRVQPRNKASLCNLFHAPDISS